MTFLIRQQNLNLMITHCDFDSIKYWVLAITLLIKITTTKLNFFSSTKLPPKISLKMYRNIITVT